jgi:hypothetical protein
VRFFFPDSQDQVAPEYDFVNDEYSPYRVRQRDDLYAHEVLDPVPYDGILVSKAIVDGTIKGAGKYSEAQRSRLYRYGVHKFFRLPKRMEAMGDCGAFTYVQEAEPPFTVAQVAEFYERCGFDAGVSVDHVVLGYKRGAGLTDAPEEWIARRAISLRYAEDFLAECDRRGTPFQPIGVAQGWSPESYADSVRRVQGMGYRRIAMGGMVALKTNDILETLAAVGAVRDPSTEIHLLGVSRFESMTEFRTFGVTSFDSTSPFRQAFMDERDNYQTENGNYVALRIPQVDGNPTLKRAILAGTLDQGAAQRAERACLEALREVDTDPTATGRALSALATYESLLGPKVSYVGHYERTLADRPWTKCDCSLCLTHGIQIAIFRGAERNKRRGFHNIAMLGKRVRSLPKKKGAA